MWYNAIVGIVYVLSYVVENLQDKTFGVFNTTASKLNLKILNTINDNGRYLKFNL